MATERPTRAGDPAAELWRFTLAVYGRPGVSAACLALQDEAGLDVNLLLFCCWAGLRGHRFSRAELDDAAAAAGPWQQEILAPLRAIRRKLKHAPGLELEAGAALYAQAKALELAAEEAEQQLLAAAVPFAAREAGDADQAACAAANLRLYAGAAAAGHAAALAALLAGCFGLAPVTLPSAVAHPTH
ncbi:MAG: TIGR02444 family protein [Dongiaceae bacterium]